MAMFRPKKDPLSGNQDIDLESDKQKEEREAREARLAEDEQYEALKLQNLKGEEQKRASKGAETTKWNASEAALLKEIKESKPTPQKILDELAKAVKDTQEIFDDFPVSPDSDKLWFFQSMEGQVNKGVEKLMADKGPIMRLLVYDKLYVGEISLPEAKKLDPMAKNKLAQQIIQLNQAASVQHRRADETNGAYKKYCADPHLDHFAKMKKIINDIHAHAQAAGLVAKPSTTQSGSMPPPS